MAGKKAKSAAQKAKGKAEVAVGELTGSKELKRHGTADKATKPEGSRAFHERAGSLDKTLNLYEGHVHDLLRDLDKELVMVDIARWIEARIGQA